MSKVDRITRVRNTLTRDELRRRLPEIALISDDDIREGTERAFLLGCPDGFWEKPSSSTGKYHLSDETGKYGNFLHTKRVFTTYLVLSRTFMKQGLIDEYERECGMSAALLHDMVKYGWPSERNQHTVSNHDVIGADIADVFGELPDAVVSAIDAHNGGWADGKDPEYDFEQVFHLADYVAAKRILGTPHVIEPCEELVEEYDPPTLTEDEVANLL